MSKNIIFISEQLFKERTGASNQIDSKQLIPMIKVAQDMHIHPALGSTLYNRLQNGIDQNNLTPIETTLLDDYITDALIWFTMSMLPMVMGFQLFSKGFLQKSSEESQAPSRADLELIEQKYQSMAEFYKQRLIRYLQENDDSFQEYLNNSTSLDSIQPESDAYTCPIYIGNEGEIGQYTSCGNGGSGSGGGSGECGDCPVSVNQEYIGGDGTEENPLTLSSQFLDSLNELEAGKALPTPIISLDHNNLYVHFNENGYDFSAADNPEIFLFRWRNVRRKKKPNQSSAKKKLAGWVHPTTYDSMNKYPAGTSFFRGKQFIYDAGATPIQYDDPKRTTEFPVPNGLQPYQKFIIPMNKYMFYSEWDELNGRNNKFKIDDPEIFYEIINGLPEWKYQINDKVNRFDNTIIFGTTGTRRDKEAPHTFKKTNTYCLAYAVDNPAFQPNNGKCPKIFSAFSNPFHIVWNLNGSNHTYQVDFALASMNRLSRAVRPNHF